ncbi:kinase-like domain [Cordyceps militaris]|uniref:Kinase-like domain n=1 Tax=Cordyceps militaris TaxID=73501 RepID=A0A2H4S8E0_CORMI|nr:kinase-like domain [Cordyceps militaris]
MSTEGLITQETNDVAYEFTATTFKKSSKLGFADTRLDGTPYFWFRSWNHERITNEAKALELIANKTTIPVPRLIEHGIHPNGCRYLITEIIDGIILDRVGHEGCLQPKDQLHTEADSCQACADQAYSNALAFISNVVIPQLSALKSKERGIDGFVMPPRWLSPDVLAPWRGKKAFQTLPLQTPEYTFQHGDLAAHNIMMDKKTLQFKALIDWEYAGFFPVGMDRWPGTLDSDAYREVAEDLAPAIARFLPQEYVECYEAWSDKKQLEDLVRAGEIPDPVEVKKQLGVFIRYKGEGRKRRPDQSDYTSQWVASSSPILNVPKNKKCKKPGSPQSAGRSSDPLAVRRPWSTSPRHVQRVAGAPGACSVVVNEARQHMVVGANKRGVRPQTLRVDLFGRPENHGSRVSTCSGISEGAHVSDEIGESEQGGLRERTSNRRRPDTANG